MGHGEPLEVVEHDQEKIVARQSSFIAVTGERPGCWYRLSQGTGTCDIIYTKWIEVEGGCRCCGEESETDLHYLTKCHVWIRTRMTWFEEYLPSPDLIINASASSILGFWKVAGLP